MKQEAHVLHVISTIPFITTLAYRGTCATAKQQGESDIVQLNKKLQTKTQLMR